MTMDTIFDAIKQSNYAATEQDVEQLAALHTAGELSQSGSDGSYLKVLLAACQGIVSPSPKKKGAAMIESHSNVLNDVHTRFYPWVLKGVAGEDCKEEEGISPEEERRRRLERLRRATFARSAKSTIEAYIRANGDIRTLDLGLVTKTGLQRFVNETKGTPSWEQAVHTNRNRIEKICRRLAQTNPGEAREILESVLQHIQDTLESLRPRKASDVSAVQNLGMVRGQGDSADVEVHIPTIGEFQDAVSSH
jgi:hypothetical protein